MAVTPSAGSWIAVGSAQAADVLILAVQRALVIAFAMATVTDAHQLSSGADGVRREVTVEISLPWQREAGGYRAVGKEQL